MTRDKEILFRGFHPCKDGDTIIYVEGNAFKGQWVEGFYSHDYLTTEIMLAQLKTMLDIWDNEVATMVNKKLARLTERCFNLDWRADDDN